MRNRLVGVGLFSAGILIGNAVTGPLPEPAVSAQGSWQCRSWTVQATEGAEAVGPWLGGAAQVEISTTTIEMNGRYVLVACKR